ARRCAFQPLDVFRIWGGGGPDGFSEPVFNAPAIGDVDGDGVNDIVAGSWAGGGGPVTTASWCSTATAG
ncbi:MAG: hypothetical protein ACRD0F_04290, partial [Acidimicrobiales bacterium]